MSLPDRPTRPYIRAIADNLTAPSPDPYAPARAVRPSAPLTPRSHPYIPDDHNAPATRPHSDAQHHITPQRPTRLHWHPGRLIAALSLGATLAALGAWALAIVG